MRDKHKGETDFHPWGDNKACHRDTYPAQHLCHSTGEEVFLQGTRINQREPWDHRERDGILFHSTPSKGELQQEKLLERDFP